METTRAICLKASSCWKIENCPLSHVDSQEVYEVTQQQTENVKNMKECDSIFLLLYDPVVIIIT